MRAGSVLSGSGAATAERRPEAVLDGAGPVYIPRVPVIDDRP
jgi:hypothetical protein